MFWMNETNELSALTWLLIQQSQADDVGIWGKAVPQLHSLILQFGEFIENLLMFFCYWSIMDINGPVQKGRLCGLKMKRPPGCTTCLTSGREIHSDVYSLKCVYDATVVLECIRVGLLCPRFFSLGVLLLRPLAGYSISRWKVLLISVFNIKPVQGYTTANGHQSI